MGTFHVVFQAVTNVIVIGGVAYAILFIRRVERERNHAYRTPVAAIKGIAEATLERGASLETPVQKQLEAMRALAADALAASERR